MSRTFLAWNFQVSVPTRVGRAAPRANSDAVITRTTVSDRAATASREISAGVRTSFGLSKVPVAATT